MHDVVLREDVWVVSKLWNTFHRKEHVKEAVMRSLKDWGVSYFDLYYVHFRACFLSLLGVTFVNAC